MIPVMRTLSPAVVVGLLALALPPGAAVAQTAGREPAAGQAWAGGSTLVDTANPVTSTGLLRLWRAYSASGARAMLKVWRPEGGRLVLVGTSPLEAVPAGGVATFPCSIPVSRNDLVGVFCPDDTCLDRFGDGSALAAEGDAGTSDLDAFADTVGGPALSAGTGFGVDIPSTASTDLVLPAAARTPGANGTYWTTDLELFNTATEATTVALFFNRSDRDNTSPAASAQVVLPPRATITFADALASLFDVAVGTGALDILASSPVIAHARVSTPAAGGGTYGQLVPAVPARWAVGDDDASGVNPASDTLYLFALAEGPAFRTNLGVVNVSGVPLALELRATAAGDAPGEPVRLELEPFSHTQVNQVLLALGLAAGATDVRVDVDAVEGSAGRFLAYASRVDNATGDAVFLLGSREAALPD